MTARLSPIAAPGSLFKRIRPELRRRRKQANREHDDRHLAAVRRCPCLACDQDPAGEAAHLRIGAPDKPLAGIGRKPDDRWALPLCPDCHARAPGAQHRIGEVPFWTALGLDPLAIAARLFAVSPDVPAMRAIVFAEREKRK